MMEHAGGQIFQFKTGTVSHVIPLGLVSSLFTLESRQTREAVKISQRRRIQEGKK